MLRAAPRCAAALASARHPRAFNADAFLAGLLDHEQRGVPAGAGAPASPAAFPLARMHALLAALGSPHATLPVLHVAGSKGKGSTAAFAAAVLRAAGYRVCVYSSPHFGHVSERLQSGENGTSVSRGDFEALVARNAAAITAAQAACGGALTHFEVTTALALRHFADVAPDVAVVEVGLGGAHDATNVFDASTLEAAVITTLDKEHTAALGRTWAHIAAAKAGILRAGRPAVIAAGQAAAAQAPLRACVRRSGAVLVARSMARATRPDGDDGALAFPAAGTSGGVTQALDVRLRYSPAGGGPAVAARFRARTALVGAHQALNAQTAAAAVAALCASPPSAARARAAGAAAPWRVPVEAFAAGLAAATLPGRFSAAQPAAGAPRLVADGAHSPAAAAALAAALSLPPLAGEPLAFVLALAADKDVTAVMAPLASLRPAAVVMTQVPIAGARHRAAAPAALAAAWRAAGGGVAPSIADSLPAAIAAAAAAVGPRGTVCVTGSLHAAWAAQQALKEHGASLLMPPQH